MNARAILGDSLGTATLRAFARAQAGVKTNKINLPEYYNGYQRGKISSRAAQSGETQFLTIPARVHLQRRGRNYITVMIYFSIQVGCFP